MKGNQNVTYGNVQIHTNNKGLIKEDLIVRVNGKDHIVKVVEKIRDITVIDIQKICKVYDEEKGTKDGENKLGDTDIEIDDGDKEDTVVGDSLDGKSSNEDEGSDVDLQDKEVEVYLLDSSFEKVVYVTGVDEGSMFFGETKVCETFNDEDDSSKKEAAARVNEKSCRDEKGLEENIIEDGIELNNGMDSNLELKVDKDMGLKGRLDVRINNTLIRKQGGPKHKIICRDINEGETVGAENNARKQKCNNRIITTQKDNDDIEAQENMTVRREKRGVSLSSLVGSRGDRSRKKRKSYDEEVFGGDGVEKAFNKVGVVGLRENKKGILDDYKEYHEESRENNGIFRFGNSKEDEAQSKRCNINLEQVKDIGKMIDVSWKLAEDVMSRKTVDRVDSKEELISINVRGIGEIGKKDTRIFTCKEVVGDERFIALKGLWKGKVEDVFLVCIYGPQIKNVKASLKGWSKDRFGGHKEKIEVLKKEVMRWEVEAERRTLTEVERRLVINDVWSEDPKLIKMEMARHYKPLFSEEREARPIFCSDRLEKISEDDARVLENEFSGEESDLMRTVLWFWEKMEISRGCNSSFITIIRKIPDPIGLGDFRPISLIGCYYKIIAKMLAERVKRVVGSVVEEVKSAFIKGRYILDGALIANETMDFLKRSRKKGLIFKVDFKKVYDSIKWNFLLNIMNRMGFGVKWRKWVEVCLRPSCMSILVNGSLTEEFGLERGVRQGDPLSPFLFILAAKGLNMIVNEAVEIGILRGVKVGANNVMVSHLQYADDNIFFGDWNNKSAKSLMCILKCFKEVSGLRVNYNKSKLYGIGVSEVELMDMAGWMGCGVGEFPFTYLRLPICENMRRINAWNLVVEKFKSRLADWKAKMMSFGGRLTLVKSVLGKKVSWVKWDLVLASYGMKGLNIRDRWRWTLCEDGEFKVKDLSRLIEEKILHVESGMQETLWNKLVPRKVNIFVWRALKGRLLVRKELDKRGIDLDSVLCPCCTNAVESCAHSLVMCDLAMSVWNKVFSWWKLGSVNDFSNGEFFFIIWER
ncbi:putative RNA-directed DNA polymerase, eukaryota, reverse transcriptase zinc-binding domain protein [Tanacetum coccineum]